MNYETIENNGAEKPEQTSTVENEDGSLDITLGKDAETVRLRMSEQYDLRFLEIPPNGLLPFGDTMLVITDRETGIHFPIKGRDNIMLLQTCLDHLIEIASRQSQISDKWEMLKQMAQHQHSSSEHGDDPDVSAYTGGYV